jgi:hypothetical protein
MQRNGVGKHGQPSQSQATLAPPPAHPKRVGVLKHQGLAGGHHNQVVPLQQKAGGQSEGS